MKEKNEELGTGSDPDPVLSGHREKERNKAKAHKTQKKANQTATEKKPRETAARRREKSVHEEEHDEEKFGSVREKDLGNFFEDEKPWEIIVRLNTTHGDRKQRKKGLKKTRYKPNEGKI